MTDRYLSVHAHFYQPPREDPFTGTIPFEQGAEPFANFNEKINAECYRPNAELGNFERISFDLGPTLARWLAQADPETYARIIESDRAYRARYGVGNAIAQAYNHTILPLAPRYDRITQIAWGIADFQHRFGRLPGGMWLPEMAVDLETLEILAAYNIRFTILCPHQVRLPDGSIPEPTHPYLVRLPSGQRITVFLRDEAASNRLAFEPRLTEDAADFIQNVFGENGVADGLHLIAVDGETFGHHQPLRTHFLRALLETEAVRAGFVVTTPTRYLLDHPPQAEVQIVEGTSWSCSHGLDRWSTGCSCTPGDSRWKAALFTAVHHLAGAIDALYLQATQRWVLDPWALRHAYIGVILGERRAEDLLRDFAPCAIPTEVQHRILTLLQAQRYRQAMFTSCAWFFEDLDRIEPRNAIARAIVAVRLTHQATGVDLGPGFRANLVRARSATGLTGADLYDQLVARYALAASS